LAFRTPGEKMDAQTNEAESVVLPISMEEYLEERVPVAPGGTLFLDLDRGSVTVSSHDEECIEIVAEARGWASHLVLFHLDRKGNDIELDVDVDRWLARLLPGTRIRVEARVPRVYSVDIRTGGGSVEVDEIEGRAAVRTAAGSVRISRVVGSAELQTSGGSVRIEELDGDLRAATSGGSVRAVDVAGRVEARTTGGGIDLDMVDGPVDARTGGGGVRVAFIDEPEGHLQTGGGSIEVRFPADAGTDLDARTAAGRIRVEHPHVVGRRSGRQRLVAQVNGGGPRLFLKTGGGGIRVRALKPLPRRGRPRT
jgi:hypothetical protein